MVRIERMCALIIRNFADFGNFLSRLAYNWEILSKFADNIHIYSYDNKNEG